MKKLLSLLLIISTFVNGQSGFPVRITKTASLDFETRKVLQSMPGQSEFTYTTNAAPSSFTNVNTLNFPASEHVLVESITYQANNTATFYLVLNSGGGVAPSITFPVVDSGSAVVVPVNMWNYNGNPLQLFVSNGNGLPIRMNLTIRYRAFTADFNWNADKIAMFIGDSQTHGTNAPSVMFDTTWMGQIGNSFARRGINARKVIRAMDGYNTNNLETWRRAGLFNIGEFVDYVFYMEGANDAAQNIDTTTHKTNIDKMYQYMRVTNPNVKFIILGAPPANNATTEGRQVNFRLAEQNIANKYAANGDIFFISLVAAFDKSVIGNYFNSDGIHPLIGAPQNGMASTVISYLTTNNIK